jgi:hypothetical protein
VLEEETMTEQEYKAMREWATDRLYNWLTDPAHRSRLEEYLDRGAAAALGRKVRLRKSSRIPEGSDPTLSDNLLSLTAMRLARSFGEDASPEMYPSDTWAGQAGFALAMTIDYFALADRLLREFVPEYVPSEASGLGTGKDESEEV